MVTGKFCLAPKSYHAHCALVQPNVMLMAMPIGPKSARANLTLDAELLVAAKIEAAKENTSLSKWVMAAMRAALSKRKGA